MTKVDFDLPVLEKGAARIGQKTQKVSFLKERALYPCNKSDGAQSNTFLKTPIEIGNVIETG